MIAEVGKINYEAYRNHTGGVSLASGQTIPEWDALPVAIKHAWVEAGLSLLASQSEQWAALQADRDRIWGLLHEAAGWIKGYELGEGSKLYQRITEALDGGPEITPAANS